VELVRLWIGGGAPAPSDEPPESDPKDHWAFRPRTRPPIPETKDASWVRNPIDAFIAVGHERQGIEPQVEAPRNVLIRRLYLDLIGLPPTAAELATLEADQSANWYESLVDRLLADPRHGERWARHWMDIWRYSDWWGLGDQLRNSQKHIWHWRDWIVESLNNDVGYDEMVRQMLAADELYPNDLNKLRASGYLARSFFFFNRNSWMEETVEHVGKAFLGLTLNCAKCHDHKYDPIQQADFYRMRAFFEPYHVRTDLLPGEADLEKDGIPRAFDGQLDKPTYVYIRGQESNPDKSQVITPGVPELVEIEPLSIKPVSLPIDAFHPERRAWVHETYQQTARRKVEEAQVALHKSYEKAATAIGDTSTPVTKAASGEASQRVPGAMEAEIRAAELAVTAAQAELVSVERRILATRTARFVGAPQQATEEIAHDTARAAARADREFAVAKARHAVADAESRLLQAAPDKKEEVEKELKAARESVDAAVKRAEEPSEQFEPLIGAKWSATSFASSEKPDPTVEFPATSTGRRSALATWITDPRNPLTARVAVNHLWTRHYGTPLVPTVFDFGRKGQPPVHPELLDWLASELVDSGWSMKHIHRLIVSSATYRLSSSTRGHQDNLVRDPSNQWYWRRMPIRLEAQVVRDSILALSGVLDLTRGGPPVASADQLNSTRRSLYFYHSNSDRNLFLSTFDDAGVQECYRREQSIVPQQALALANSQLSLDAAQRIFEQINKVSSDAEGKALDDTDFVRHAFLTVLASEPSAEELAACTRAMSAWREPAENESKGDARVNLVWALLNHNDFVTLR
jgi:hypothetical protein